MRTTKAGILPAAGLLLGMITSANAVIIDVTPWVAPNVFGSPSWDAAEANAMAALFSGQTSHGAVGPAQFNAQSNVTSAEVVVTNFNSWRGQASPSAPYQSELGNRMHFGVRINGDGSQFSISQLSFSATSTDPFNALAFTRNNYEYGTGYWGVLKGQDGQLFTGDDIFIDSGANNQQLVDGLVGRGSGSSFAAYCQLPDCTSPAQWQGLIDEVAAYPGSGFTFTGVYSLGGDNTGSGTFTISAVPEPSTWAMMILGFAGIGFLAHRRARGAKAEAVAA